MDDEQNSSAGDALQGGQGGQITVPQEMLPNVKPGDTLKVSGVQGGNVMLEVVSQDSGDDSEQWANEAKAAVPMEQ
jgi:hypothetical protein